MQKRIESGPTTSGPSSETGRQSVTARRYARKSCKAAHRVVDKAGVVVAEDLTKRFAGRKTLGKNMNRRLAGWTKGVTAEALANVSERRGSALVHVNAAYTSQACHRCGRLGRRSGDRLHCTSCGVVWQADVNAAINILQRAGDPDIALHTPHDKVRQILQERTDRHRTRLPVQDSSPATVERRANHPNGMMSNQFGSSEVSCRTAGAG
ncbi:transposase [Micromonospora chersina]|uniref:transposase n=1 Tax=Micromonospora chersina TaxID=47854 RepID=UPI003456557E